MVAQAVRDQVAAHGRVATPLMDVASGAPDVVRPLIAEAGSTLDDASGFIGADSVETTIAYTCVAKATARANETRPATGVLAVGLAGGASLRCPVVVPTTQAVVPETLEDAEGRALPEAAVVMARHARVQIRRWQVEASGTKIVVDATPYVPALDAILSLTRGVNLAIAYVRVASPLDAADLEIVARSVPTH